MYLPQIQFPHSGLYLHENPADTPQNHNRQITFCICPPLTVHREKIVELCRVHLLETVQNHVVECFDQGNNDWLMNQVQVMLLWAENLELIQDWYVALNDDPDYFFEK